MIRPALPARARIASMLSVLAATTCVAFAAPASAAAPTGSLHLRQSADCTGPDVTAGSAVRLPFSIAFVGFAADSVGVLDYVSEDGSTSGTRFTTGDTGTTCSAYQSAAYGGFEVTFSYTDAAGGARSASVVGVVVTGTPDPVPTGPAPSDTSNPDTDPYVTPIATAVPTRSPGAAPTPQPSSSTSASTSTSTLPRTGTAASRSRLAVTGADPRLLALAVALAVVGIVLYAGAGRTAPRRRR
jgi:opacity protein-like surface antigen